MAVDPASVKRLREMTGLPMMECKKALDASDGEAWRYFDFSRGSAVESPGLKISAAISSGGRSSANRG